MLTENMIFKLNPSFKEMKAIPVMKVGLFLELSLNSDLGVTILN